MVPTAYVRLESLPLTPNGKLDRRALPDPDEYLAAEAAPSAAGQAQTPYHEMLIGIWRQLLGATRVGIDDSFFELGGHSLLATQLMSRIRKAFGVDVALRVLFERPTVRGLGEVIEEAVRAGHGVAAPPLAPVERGRELPLSFAQQRLWFLDQLEPGNAYYNCPVAVRMKGRLDVGAFERTLQEVMRRHEALRTRFPAVEGQPSQKIQSEVESRLPVVDISELETDRMESEAERLAREEGDRAFDLSLGPMLRAILVRVGEDEYVVLFTMHHIVSDAWSMNVLVREVAALYEAFSQGRPSPLPELPIQYADYAVWQREWLQGEALEKQLAYWRERLGGKLQAFELPTDRPRPAALSYHGARHTFMLEEGLTAGLKELSRSSGTTLFMTLLAGFKTLLYRETGQEDLLIGTAIAGRNRSETEGLIGFFINTLALRTDLSGAPKFTDLLAQVKSVALGAYAHQDLPFDKLVEDLQPERSASRAPIVQVTFGLRNAPETELELPGLTFSALGIEREMGRYDVTLWMSEVDGQLSGVWTYMTELYDLETIKRLTGHFETLLRSIVAQPEARLHTLEILTEAEKQELDLKEERRQVLLVHKLKDVKRKSVSASPELSETAQRR